MITIGETYFKLEGPVLDDDALQKYATELFQSFDANASALPISDYSLLLDIEEGSIKGKGTIAAGIAALYFGIGELGDFVQGVKEISAIVKGIGAQLIADATNTVGCENTLSSKRHDAGRLTRVERLFAEVQRGSLDPAEASRQVVRIFSEEEEVPAEMVSDIETSVARIRADPKQLNLLEAKDGEIDCESLETIPTPSRERKRLPRGEVLPPRRIRVEIRKDGKNGKTTVRVVSI